MRYEETLFYHFSNYPLLLERFYYNKYYYFTNITYGDIKNIAIKLYDKVEVESILTLYKNTIIDNLANKYTTVVQLDIFGKMHNREIPSKPIIRKLILDYTFYFNGDTIDISAIYNMLQAIYNIKIMTRQQIKFMLEDMEEIKVEEELYYLKSIEKDVDIIDSSIKTYKETIIKEIHPDNINFIIDGIMVEEIIKKDDLENVFLFAILKHSLKSLAHNEFLKILYKNPSHPSEKEKRNIAIILQRKEKLTLAQIGESYDLAKERIRQILEEYINSFQEMCMKSNNYLLSIIKGFAQNQALILHDDILSILGNDTEIFMYLLEKINVPLLTHLADINAYIINGENWMVLVDNMLDAAKESLSITEGEKLIHDIIFELKKNNIEIYYSPIQKKFHGVYNLKGSIYNKTSLTQSGKYRIIMDLFFPKGFSIHNDDEMHLFRLKYEETFKESLENKTTRSIEGRIEDTCILVDRGTYKAYKGEQLSYVLVEKIESYIDVSINKTFAFNSLFLIFQEDLKAEKVYNRYYFQALLKKSVTKRYFFSRDYVSKQKDSNFIDEIETVIYNNGNAINLEMVNKEIPGVTQIMFVAAMDKLNMISLFNGEYISLNNVLISDVEFHKLERIIENLIRGDKIVSAKELYSLAHYELVDLFKNNDINAYTLYGIAKSCFRDKFQFKRPFIASNNIEIGDRKERIKAFLGDYKLISISDLREFMLENDLVIPDMLKFIEELDGFVRNDENSLISGQLLSADKDTILDIERHLKGYEDDILIKNIDCSKFPTIGVSWNYWLLASLLNKSGIQYKVVATNNSYKAPAYILQRVTNP